MNGVCAFIDQDGYIVAVDRPQSAADCPLVLQDYESFQNQALMPWNLDTSQATQLAVAILSVWAVGFCFRCLVQMVKY